MSYKEKVQRYLTRKAVLTEYKKIDIIVDNLLGNDMVSASEEKSLKIIKRSTRLLIERFKARTDQFNLH